MLFHNGQVAVIHVESEHKQEKFKFKPNMGEHNALANSLKVVTWRTAQVSQILFKMKNKLFNLSLFQLTALPHNGPAAAIPVDQESKQEKYKSKLNMEAYSAQASWPKVVTWKFVKVRGHFYIT